MAHLADFLISWIIDGIKNYGHLGCYAPIEAWYIGNYCILEAFIISSIPLCFLEFGCSDQCIIPFVLFLWMLVLACLGIWTIIGTVFVVLNVIAGNHCLTAFDYVWITLWQGSIHLMSWTLGSLIIMYVKLLIKKNKLKKELISLYSNPSQPIKERPEQLITKYQTILNTMQILDIEKDLIKKYFTSRHSANNQNADECPICLGEFETESDKSRISCVHEFHYECLMDWFKIKPTCPTCKQSFRKQLLLKLCDERGGENNA